MRGLFIPGLGPGYRLTVEDAPAETDIEVLPHALEAYNESQWPRIHPGDRSPFSSGTTYTLSLGWRVKPIAGDYSQNIFGCRTDCAVEASGAS